MDTEKLNQAIQLIKSGNKPAALPILKALLQENPRDENAWLWLYSCVERPDQKKYCLQKALEINPLNQGAQNALKKLDDQIPQSQPAPSVALKSGQSQSLPVADVASEPPEPNYRPWWAALGIGLFLLICITPFAYLALAGQLSTAPANLPGFLPASLTPSPTATLTLTPTPNPTATPAPTRTRRPILTVTPAGDTPIPFPTRPPFTPGNPTATPLGSEITDPNFRQGVEAYYQGKNEAVIQLMSVVIENNPQLAPPYQYRGSAYWALGNCVSGLEDLDKAVVINPMYAEAWANRGLVNDCLGNTSQALFDYQKALSIDPSFSFAHHNLGIHYYANGEYEKALEEDSLSVEIEPGRSDWWASKAETEIKLDKNDQCLLSATRAIELDPENWGAYLNRGYCEGRLAKMEEALKDYTAALQGFKIYAAKNPNDPVGPYNIGVAYGHRGDVYYYSQRYREAIPDYEKAVSLIEGDAHSYCNLAYSYFETQQYQKMIDAAQASLAINPLCGGIQLIETEARSAYALGKYDQGIELMNEAMAQGGYPLGYYYRGILYDAAGNKEAAIHDLQIYLDYGYGGSETEDAKARLAKLKP